MNRLPNEIQRGIHGQTFIAADADQSVVPAITFAIPFRTHFYDDGVVASHRCSNFRRDRPPQSMV